MNSEFIRKHYPDARTRFRRDRVGPYAEVFGLASGIPAEVWRQLFMANGFTDAKAEWTGQSYRIRLTP